MRNAASGSGIWASLALMGALTACSGDRVLLDATPPPPDAEAPLAAAQLTVTPQSVKTLRFSWSDAAGETRYVLLEDRDGASGLVPVAELAADSTAHELTVFLPDRVNARYVLQTCKGGACADSAAVGVSAQLAKAIGYFKASNADERDEFGGTIALSRDGDTLAVSAIREASASEAHPGDNSLRNSGAVYVFARSSGGWQQQGLLKGSSIGAERAFGFGLCLSADGNTLAVGSPGDAGGGSAFVFTRDGGAWTQQRRFAASNAGGLYGLRVALAGDGRTLAVGAVFESGGSTGVDGNQFFNAFFERSGAVFVYTRGDSPASWAYQSYLKASNTGAGDQFGGQLGMSDDGNTLAVGAQFEDSGASGVGANQLDDNAADSGAVYVFLRSGATWSQQAYLKASNSAEGSRFGAGLSLSADGHTLAVGAPREDSDAAGMPTPGYFDRGAVYVFRREGAVWGQQALLKAGSSDDFDQFGGDVALSPDGARLAVGAEFEDSQGKGFGADASDNSSPESGAVYLFAQQGGAWVRTHFLKAPNTGDNDFFGNSLALAGSAASPVLAVGAAFERGGSQGMGGDLSSRSSIASGAVYLY